jgi:uncharacterized protein YggE
MSTQRVILLAALSLASAVHAQTAPAAATTGTLVVVPASGEVRHANDEATVDFTVDEQDKDRATAVARATQKMKQGTEILKRADPQAEFKTVGFSTYPVYPEQPQQPRPLATRPVPIGWRVSQTLEMTTRSLDNLPKTVAAAQKAINLTGINYHLSRELTRRMDDERIAATYRNLNERIASIARAMGRNVADAVVDTVDFEASGNYARGMEAAPAAPMMMRAKAMDADLPEPSFEPGETTLQMQVVGKVRFR